MPAALLYHYMDDILVAAEKKEVMEEALALVSAVVSQAGLWVSPEKVQSQPPWKYLGWRIRTQSVSPQPLQIHTDIRTLHDAQKCWAQLTGFVPC